MRRLFYPTSVAIAGLSTSETNLAASILSNLEDFGYEGRVYGVGRSGGSIRGVTIYPSIRELPEAVDVVVFLTPSHLLPGLFEDCGARGIDRGIVLSAGLTEFADGRKDLEDEILATARRYGILFVGPNTMGVINLMNNFAAPFSQMGAEYFRRGDVGIFAQSGTVGPFIAYNLGEAGFGASTIIMGGNKLCLDEADYLRYFIDDPATAIIYFHIEGFKRPREFFNLARQSPKPIILYKANVYDTSSRAAKSHTASISSDDRFVSAAVRQSGVIRIPRPYDHGVNAVRALRLPPLRGSSLGLLCGSGGNCIISADLAREYGFSFPAFPQEVTRAVAEQGRAGIMNLGNPMDLGDIFDGKVYAEAVKRVADLPFIDGVVAALFHLPKVPGNNTAMFRYNVESVFEQSQRTQRPIAMVHAGHPSHLAELVESSPMPLFPDLQDAFEGLAYQHAYWAWRAARDGARP